MGPLPVRCHIVRQAGLLPLQLPCFISFLPQIFSKNFPSSHFPLSASSYIRVRPLFIFTLYAHASYILYAIFYFCFTLRCRDEFFFLKYFKNTGCQSLLAINSLLAKFFKSLCYDRFYCIQQVSMSWVIYNFSHMFICLLWFCHGLPKGEIVRTYVNHVRNICQYRIG